MGDVGVIVVCQGLAPLDEGDSDALVLHVLAYPPEDKVHDGLVETSPLGGEVPQGLGSELGSGLL